MYDTRQSNIQLAMPSHVNKFANDSYRPPTVQEKRSWNGFCELESEPALFNAMLRDFGVRGVKVQEVVSLDEEMMTFLNKPVYGLIFLFRWREDDPDKQEASCPEGLWFANQTTSNACASVALLNIVNNIEGIELGANLQHFKDFTMPFTPALRGDAISNFEFVKQIHNSFARKMDMLNSDLQLKHESTSRRSRSSKSHHDETETDAGFHFIAFVPVLGKVWKFDGLERQPQVLGPCSHDMDWLDLVKPNLITRMTEYEEDQIEFSILSLSKDPLLDLASKLAVNIKCLEVLNQRLATQDPAGVHGGLAFASPILENTILGPEESYDMTREFIDQAIVPVELDKYDSCSVQEIVEHRQKLCNEQLELRAAIREEQQTQRADDDYAVGRMYDYEPAIRRWVRILARKGKIESLIPVGV
ncbi:ubiquitin carboxyl-terminal hydrolase [Aspergillus coremiiformis]|uniref:Ubiquitin carboxyl-terminal hydrolase n=1 Tax=Aspergillus coremiiformis TaxID=138285 RepID=A0A5N6YT42_9EURO|nr:ubiquitin carboxyl-terminal hydrolase [Aspergillus coremiiformis]